MRPKRPWAVSGRTWMRGARKPFQAKRTRVSALRYGELAFYWKVSRVTDEGEGGSRVIHQMGMRSFAPWGFGAD